MRKVNMAAIAALTCASLALGACSQLSGAATAAKSFVYSKGAKIGNDYCEVRDEEIVADLKTRMNAGLRAEGAEFDFDPKIKCDPR